VSKSEGTDVGLADRPDTRQLPFVGCNNGTAKGIGRRCYCTEKVRMTRISNAWARLRIQIRDLRPQLRLSLRVTVPALVSFVFGKSLNIPFGGLWAVLTAVVVTQVSGPLRR
jgi:uncharacterized membrane protein YccC